MNSKKLLRTLDIFRTIPGSGYELFRIDPGHVPEVFRIICEYLLLDNAISKGTCQELFPILFRIISERTSGTFVDMFCCEAPCDLAVWHKLFFFAGVIGVL